VVKAARGVPLHHKFIVFRRARLAFWLRSFLELALAPGIRQALPRETSG
jgi:hypothetical protein